MGKIAVVLVWTLILTFVVRFNDFFGVAIVNEQVMKLLFLGSGGLLLLWRASLAWQLFRAINPFILMFVALGWCSFAWSIEPKLTFLRMLTLSGYVLVIASFVLYDWTPQRFQTVMRGVLLAIPLLSYAAWVLQPDFVIERGDDISLKGSWKGLTGQKNTFGQLAAFATIFWWHALLNSEGGRRMAIFGFLASLWAVLLSRSSTALLATVPTCGFLWLLMRSRPNLKRYMPAISTGFALMVVIYSMAVLKVVPGLDLILEPIMAMTGKDQTFSGRSVIWEVIRKHIEFAPMLGTGFGAYWAGPAYTWSPSWDVARVMYIYPFQAHNGYLDTINDLGYVGLSVLVGYMITFMRHSLRLFRVDRAQGSLYLALFFMMAISNLSQSIWFTSNIEFIVMIFATFALGRTMLEVKLKAMYNSQPPQPTWQQRSPFMR